MSNWKNDFIKKNKYTRPGRLLKMTNKIVVHWTGNPGASAKNHQTYFNDVAIKQKRYASAHIFIDKNEAICIVPLNEVAFHANDGMYRGVKELKPNANDLSIGVEMCVEKNKTIAIETINRTVNVIAELCKIYNLTEKDIVRHYDVTRKNCPKPFVDNQEQFIEFKNSVGALLKRYPGMLLKKGIKNEYVGMIQRKLDISVDNNFGIKTEREVKKFQKENNLLVDGKVGEITWGKMFL